MSELPRPDVSQLRELALPEPVSYLPQTWGWLLLALLLAAGLALWAASAWRRRARNRYRREALQRLEQLESLLDDERQRPAALRELPELLKRVALSIPAAPAVGSASGAQWQAFLQRSSRTPLPADFAAQLALLAYAPESQLRALDVAHGRRLLALGRHWVETHHVAA